MRNRLFLALLLITGCSSDPSPVDPPGSPPPTTPGPDGGPNPGDPGDPGDPGNPGDPGTPGDPGPADPCLTDSEQAAGSTVQYSFDLDDRTRSFYVHVPEGYTGDESIPLVFVNHGYLQLLTTLIINGTAFDDKADEEGFIAVFGTGVSASWNAGSCCGTAQSSDVDDVAFFRAMLDYVREDIGLCVDRRRVYATGFSNGGFMSYRLACEASDLFAAIAPSAGSLMIPKASCEEEITRPVPMLHIHGTGDTTVSYDGSGSGTGNAVQSFADWADISGCGTTTTLAATPPSTLGENPSVGQVECLTYEGCPADVEVTLCSVEAGGHCWFGSPTCGTGVPGVGGNNSNDIHNTNVIWDFFSRHICEECGL